MQKSYYLHNIQEAYREDVVIIKLTLQLLGRAYGHDSQYWLGLAQLASLAVSFLTHFCAGQLSHPHFSAGQLSHPYFFAGQLSHPLLCRSAFSLTSLQVSFLTHFFAGQLSHTLLCRSAFSHTSLQVLQEILNFTYIQVSIFLKFFLYCIFIYLLKQCNFQKK